MRATFQSKENHVTDIAITTATVDIQVMRIGTKQMTLAVFRQLPMKTIWTPAGELCSPPWGWVNYDHQYRGRPYVFSYEGTLYRDDIDIVTQLCLHRPGDELPREYYQPPKYVSSWEVHYSDVYKPIVFPSETAALAYYANRLAALDVLRSAPQLFIGV